MDQHLVTAAKWFGGSLIVSSIISIFGLYVIVDRSTQQLSKAIVHAGSAAQPHPGGAFVGTLQIQTPEQIKIAPVQVSVRQEK